MKIFTAITDDYRDLQAILQRSTTAVGYTVNVVNLPDSYRVVNPPGVWVAHSPWKPRIILDQLRQMKSDGSNDLLVWLDGDVGILRRFDEVDSHDYDYAVTLRTDPIEWFRKINAGVLFFYPTPVSFAFLEEWIATVPLVEYESDQYAINTLLRGRDFKSFPEDVYNFTEWDSPPNKEVKIVHCLTKYRAKAVDWMLTRQPISVDNR